MGLICAAHDYRTYIDSPYMSHMCSATGICMGPIWASHLIVHMGPTLAAHVNPILVLQLDFTWIPNWQPT